MVQIIHFLFKIMLIKLIIFNFQNNNKLIKLRDKSIKFNKVHNKNNSNIQNNKINKIKLNNNYNKLKNKNNT